ncbi:MAG: hypothetical protein ACJAYU_003503 [Bradymonadia bacterium]
MRSRSSTFRRQKRRHQSSLGSTSRRAGGRETEIAWFEAGRENRARVQISFSAAAPCDGYARARLEAAFPFVGTTIAYSPALIEDEVQSYQFDDFSWLIGEVYLLLSSGLIGIG